MKAIKHKLVATGCTLVLLVSMTLTLVPQDANAAEQPMNTSAMNEAEFSDWGVWVFKGITAEGLYSYRCERWGFQCNIGDWTYTTTPKIIAW